jgi:hypothetical protein
MMQTKRSIPSASVAGAMDAMMEEIQEANEELARERSKNKEKCRKHHQRGKN